MTDEQRCPHCGMPLGPDMRPVCAHDPNRDRALPYPYPAAAGVERQS